MALTLLFAPGLTLVCVLNLMNLYLFAKYTVHIARTDLPMAVTVVSVLTAWICFKIYVVLKEDERARVTGRRAVSSSEDECSICYTVKPDWLLPCSHRFHETCIRHWAQAARRTCPLCRASIE